MKYLVTGATGFLGTHLVRALEDHGHTVVGFSRRSGGDVLDRARVHAAAVGCDGAFHCAGFVSRRREDAEALYRVHVEGTKTVLDACADAGVRRVVLASTSGTIAVSDDPERVSTEEDDAPIALVSRWPYYRAKLFAERAALGRNGPRLEVVSVNPSLLLGPGDVNGTSTEDVRLFLESAVPAVPSGGLAFVDVRDAADALMRAMGRGRPGERYLVSACNLTVRDFFGRLSRVSGVRAPWLPMPRSRELASLGASWMDRLASRVGFRTAIDPVSVEMGQSYWYVDAAKATSELDWQPRDPGETLLDTVLDLRARGVVWPRDHALAR